MKKLFQTPLHIVFLPLFPVLTLIAHNSNELFLAQMFVPIALVLFSVFTLLFFVNMVFLKNMAKSACAISLAFFIFRPFATIDIFRGGMQPHQYVALHKTTIFLALFFVLGMALIIKPLRLRFGNVTLLFNIFAISFVMLPLVSFLRIPIQRLHYATVRLNPIRYKAKHIKAVNAPDIYYIVIDRYASEQTLSSYYTYDDSEFLSALKNRGFYVASQSAANYPFTIPSLASTLNLDYLDSLYHKMSKGSEDRTPIRTALEDSEVVRYLKARGYTYYHFGDEWITTTNKHADFQYVYSSKTPNQIEQELASLGKDANPLAKFLYNNLYETTRSLLSQPQNHGNYALDQMLELSKIITRPGPKFVYVHSLLTHDPYVFDKQGVFTNRLVTNSTGDTRSLYIGQLQFTNTILIHVIDTLLSRSTNPPVIILQSDEGPYPLTFRKDLQYFDWRRATKEELQQKMRIFNAYYLPGKPTDLLYPSISPVNSFRIVFNLYLGESLPLLKDKNYAQTAYNRHYDIFDVTQIVQ